MKFVQIIIIFKKLLEQFIIFIRINLIYLTGKIICQFIYLTQRPKRLITIKINYDRSNK